MVLRGCRWTEYSFTVSVGLGIRHVNPQISLNKQGTLSSAEIQENLLPGNPSDDSFPARPSTSSDSLFYPDKVVTLVLGSQRLKCTLAR